MTETERNQIKGALFKCAEENENKFTLTGHIVVSSLCKSAVERIEELEKENAELKEQCLILADCNTCHSTFKNENVEMKKQLIKAKEIIKKFSEFVNNEVEFDPEHPQEHTDLWNELCEKAEQFLKESE